MQLLFANSYRKTEVNSGTLNSFHIQILYLRVCLPARGVGGNSLDSDSNVDFVAIVMAIVVVVAVAVIIVSIVTFDLHSWRSVFSPFSFQFNIYLRLVAVVVVAVQLLLFNDCYCCSTRSRRSCRVSFYCPLRVL